MTDHVPDDILKARVVDDKRFTDTQASHVLCCDQCSERLAEFAYQQTNRAERIKRRAERN